MVGTKAVDLKNDGAALPARKRRRLPFKKDPYKPGAVMADDTICAGKSDKTNKLVFTTPTDAIGPSGRVEEMTYEEAQAYVKELNDAGAYGHTDWHIATEDEMAVLIEHQDEGRLENSFNKMSTRKNAVKLGENGLAGMYWTSREVKDAFEADTMAWAQSASPDVGPVPLNKADRLSVRIVRSVAAGTPPEVACPRKAPKGKVAMDARAQYGREKREKERALAEKKRQVAFKRAADKQKMAIAQQKWHAAAAAKSGRPRQRGFFGGM